MGYGYKIVNCFACTRGKKFGKYKIGVCDRKFGDGKKIDVGCCLLHYDGHVYGSSMSNELRKITFNVENRSITFELRSLKKKRFHKVTLENITNKGFFEYTRKHLEKLFGAFYNITPNNDRTEFILIKNKPKRL
ncbi:MAG: hypothetical protein MJ090_06250 [Clostridia bacterium]|nr:hypothetical protein [Bacteroidaceae bacterium]MCQ2455717.1 hypothetical protein [Clostridia bacterium]